MGSESSVKLIDLYANSTQLYCNIFAAEHLNS